MSTRILNVEFSELSELEILELIAEKINSSEKMQIITPNPEILIAAEKNIELKKLLQKTLNVPDGNGIIWANQYLKKTKNWHAIFKILWLIPSLIIYPFKKNLRFSGSANLSFLRRQEKPITGTDLMFQISTNTPLFKNTSIFLLGAKPGVAAKAAEKLKLINSELNIVGTSYKNPEDASLTEEINSSKAKILFVAYGSPRQEFWIHKNLPLLHHIKCAIGVGGAFDFHSGVIKRAPILFRKFGLEWLFRLFKEPFRIKRIINAVIIFPLIILKSNLLKNHN